MLLNAVVGVVIVIPFAVEYVAVVIFVIIVIVVDVVIVVPVVVVLAVVDIVPCGRGNIILGHQIQNL